MRLEQRRVLNADFSFTPHGLILGHVDGELTVREVSIGQTSHIEFDLHGDSVWHDNGSTGAFAVDNSTAGHSILSVAKSDLENLPTGASLSAASSEFDLHFDVHSSSLDLSHMQGTLVVEGFGTVDQTASTDHDVKVADVSLSADQINLSHFHGDNITLHANEVDLTGGHDSFSGNSLSILSATTPTIELGGLSNDGASLDFTDSDIAALDASFHQIRFHDATSDGGSSIHVDASGADFGHALSASVHDSAASLDGLHLSADSVQIDGSLSISGGFIDITATHDVTITDFGSLVSHGGQVHVDAGEHGTLLDSGNIDVSNSEPGGVGGTVHLLGEQVGLFGGAHVDASGDSHGGEVLIGGDLHGDNDAIHHAAQTFVGHDVEVHADALHHGDGGTIVVWSDEVTQVYGSLTARGGAARGDGGLIETSSHHQLIVTRGGDASAANGHGGTWLLDPLNVKIVAVPSSVYQVTEFAQPPIFNPTVSGSEVTDEAIEAELATGTTVVISTENSAETEDGDVTLEVSIDVTFVNSGDSAAFIINAADDIFINGQINVMNGSLDVILEANHGSDDGNTTLGNVYVNADINTNGGLFFSSGVNFDSAGINLENNPGNTMPMIATITASGGVSINHSGIVDLGPISTGTEFGGTTYISNANVRGDINVGEGNIFINGGNEDLIVTANITATETMFLLANRDVIIDGTITAGGPTSPLNPSANLSITSDADSDGVGGFWMKDSGSSQLLAGGDISIVGANLIDPVGNTTGTISLRIDADPLGGPQIIAGSDLTIVANFGHVSSAGDILIDGVLQATDGALTAFFTGTAYLSANSSAGTDILFQDAVRLTHDVTLTAGNDVTFGSRIDDDGIPATGSELTVLAGGDALFVGKIGDAVDPGLDALTVTSDGLIDFLNSVTVNGNILVTATSTTDRTTFQGAVTTTNGGSVTITNAGLLVTSSAAQFNVDSFFHQNGIGTTELGAGITTVDGDVTFDQAVVLTDAITIDTSSNAHNIIFHGTLDSEVTGANEAQTISLVNVDGGDFTISWVPPVPPGTGIETTTSIPFDATADDVKAALVDSFDSLTDADIDVIGDPGGPYTLVFRGAFRGTDVAEITVGGSGLTGAGANASVLTTLVGVPVVAEHNPLTLIAGAGTILFEGNIGTGFVDLALGVDGDQTLGDFTIQSASQVTFDGVTTVATEGSMDFGSVSVISSGIAINGTDPITFESGHNITINGKVTSEVDLRLQAAGDVTLTDDGSLFTKTNNSNVTIVADSNGDSVGDFVMNPATQIDAGSGFIDVSAAEVFLGKLTSASTNPTDADNPAIRVVATFRSINDINGNDVNLIANQRINLEETGAGVVLHAVTGIGSGDALETDMASLSAYNHDLSEQQVVTLANATGGTFTLDWDPPGVALAHTTDHIPFNATADQVKVAFLTTFNTLSEADLNVSGSAGGPFLFTFLGSLRATDVPQVTAADVDLVGIGATVTSATINDFKPAEHNIRILDVGSTAGRVDLIFVHNEANQHEPQFATAVQEFTSIVDGTTPTKITFSAATPGPGSNDIVIHFTVNQETHIGATANVPIITVDKDKNDPHRIDIDLHGSEDTNGNNRLDVGEDTNGNMILDKGTTANALRDAINSNHAANQLIRALITGVDPRTPGTNDISGITSGTSVSLTGAGAEDGVIDINVQNEDLRVVNDNSREVLLDMRDGTDHPYNPVDVAIPAIQGENTIRLTANTVEVFDDILAIQPLTETTIALDNLMTTSTITVVDPRVFPSAGFFFIQIDQEILKVTDITGNELTVVRGQNAASHAPSVTIANIGVDSGIRQYIEINARVNFVLGANQVITTDDHYINSLNLQEDLNGNGKLDLGEDTNGNGTLQFNTGEDTNRNGVLDPGEDLNGDGVLQLRGDKPAVAANDNFFSAIKHDSIHITADSNHTETNGRVLLGDSATISTDNGIEQQIAPRPEKTNADPKNFNYFSDTAFFSGDIAVSNLQSRFLSHSELLPDGTTLPASSIVYLGTLTFTIGTPGEKNLILDIDWGDHDRTVFSPVPPTTDNLVVPKFVNGVYVFDPTTDQHATRYLIPEGGASYSIPHDYSDNALNLKDAPGTHAIHEPGRIHSSDPFQVRFAVSQHSSIVIDGQSVLDPSTNPTDVANAPFAVPQNAPYDLGQINKPYQADDLHGADRLFQLTSTNVLDRQNLFLPHFDNGVAAFTIPVPFSLRIPKADPVIAPPELPKPAIPGLFIVTPPLLTLESTRGSASSTAITTDEFFELHHLNEDGTIDTERLRDGEGLLERDRFEEFVRDRGDGNYEIWFITRENGTGARIERPVIQFRLEGGRIAAPASDDQKLFKPFRLIPVPVPPPNAVPAGQPAGNGDGSGSDTENILDRQDQEPNSNEMSLLELRRSHSEFAVWPTESPLESSMETTDASTHEFATAFAAGVLVFPSLSRRKHRSAANGSSAYSLSARFARKRTVLADDQ